MYNTGGSKLISKLKWSDYLHLTEKYVLTTLQKKPTGANNSANLSGLYQLKPNMSQI